ncbi:ECF transporter S component [Anaerococcus sp. WCA-380-WT-2B]|uniref:ECF transporter S component n=1 Tax=Anaerococcus porci TaxID=2652269 RepID=A0A6N7VSP5_9FIRM|nr:ECF transporter S component [Anaerococcus porci]MSS77084.1 ECF transporter S component [Anaerococcus porci]
MNNKEKTRQMVTVSMLGAITIVLGLTPMGYIPLGLINITTMHIPVIIAAILEGPVVGGLVGLIFGLSSLANAMLRPGPISFVFYNPLISIFPRILIGVFSGLTFRYLKNKKTSNIRYVSLGLWILLTVFLFYLVYSNISNKANILQIVLSIIFEIIAIIMLYLTFKNKNSNLSVAITSFVGTMTNTLFVMGLIYLFYAEKYVTSLGISTDLARSTIFGAIITNGLPEAIMSIVMVSAIIKAYKKK